LSSSTLLYMASQVISAAICLSTYSASFVTSSVFHTALRVTCNNVLAMFTNDRLLEYGLTEQQKSLFWDVMLCSLVEVNWCFKGKYCLHLQGKTVSQTNRQVASSNSRWRQYLLPEHWWRSTRLHGVTSQKIVLFIGTIVRTSNLRLLEKLTAGQILVVSGFHVLASEACTLLLLPTVTHDNPDFIMGLLFQ
jgi:hypothetical protein